MTQNDSSKSSKKLKQKKEPQRGLGVAQLEKIRLEERHKKNDVLQNSLQLQSDLQIQTVLQNKKPLLASEFLKNPQLGAHPAFKSYIGSELAKQQLNIGQGSWGKFCNGEQSLEGGGFGSSKPKSNESYDSISIPGFSALSGISAKELFRHQNSSSSMVKVSSGTSSSSSVITHNQMEPPSNQSFYSKIFPSLSKSPEKEKMIGSKRAYPFSLENLLNPLYPHKLPHLPVPAEPPKPLLRDELASSSVRPETSTEKATGKNVILDGDFLSLALPKPTLPHPTQELKEAGSNLQENDGGPSFYNFLSSSQGLNGQASNTANASSSGEVAERLDLDLKL